MMHCRKMHAFPPFAHALHNRAWHSFLCHAFVVPTDHFQATVETFSREAKVENRNLILGSSPGAGLVKLFQMPIGLKIASFFIPYTLCRDSFVFAPNIFQHSTSSDRECRTTGSTHHFCTCNTLHYVAESVTGEDYSSAGNSIGILMTPAEKRSSAELHQRRNG